MTQVGDVMGVRFGTCQRGVRELRHDLDLDRPRLEIRRDTGEFLGRQVSDRNDDGPGTGAIDMGGDIGDRSEHANSVVAQMPLGRVVVEDADSDEFVVRVLSDHIEGEHALVARAHDDRGPGCTGRGEAALPQVASNPVLETLEHDHERSRCNGDAGRDEQSTGEGEFDHPHDADTQCNRSHDCSELIGRATSVATAIDRQRPADEEDDQSDCRTDEHAWCIDEMSVEVVPHKCHRHDKEREDETIDE